MIPPFIDERLLDQMAYGFSGGPTYNTGRVGLRSGIERRQVRRSRPLHRFSGSFDRQDEGVVETLLNAYHATYGAAAGFRLKNWMDYKATDQVIGTGTGSVQSLQLTKTYSFGSASNAVMIRKPVAGTVQLYADGAPIAATINHTTGIATFSAASGAVITWSGEFDIPVSFENDEFVGMIETWGASTISVQLSEDLSA